MESPVLSRRVAIAITAVCALLVLVHLIWPILGIDGITVALLVLAALPWLLPFLKSLELPGGVKIELRDAKAATEKITSVPVVEALEPTKGEFKGRARTTDAATVPLDVANQDPNLALVGFRIELEKRLRQIAEARNIESSRMPLSRLVRELQAAQVLPSQVAAGLSELIVLGNSAAHGVPVSPAASDWVIGFAPSIMEQLDALSQSNT